MTRALLSLLFAVAAASSAMAHAFLDHAAPAVGSTVHASPSELRLWFTEPLEPAFSTVRVLNAAGQPVDRGDKQIDPSNRTLLKVGLSPLGPGAYKVMWRVLSVDGHVTEGDFTFRVAP